MRRIPSWRATREWLSWKARLRFTFSDFFAGIGGFRTALQPLGGECAYSCEWDRYSQKTYAAWYGDTPHGDIREVAFSDIPPHDVLAGGFPCQPFSLAGVSKKQSLGRAHGFACEKQGNLFFQLAAIIDEKRPRVALLENVKNLQSHDHGRTWAVIHDTLTSLGYRVFHKVIDAAAWVPQHRERVYIVCFDRKVFGDDPPFRFPDAPRGARPRLGDILENDPHPKYTLSDRLWTYLQEYADRHRKKGNGFGFGLANPDGITRTLSARYFKDGSEILIPQKRKNPRRLTPRECARLMGFPDTYPIVVSDTQAYRQFGNAVVPPVVHAIAREITTVMRRV
jgi:DNA (cytosine-5)-methyltransferase 1